MLTSLANGVFIILEGAVASKALPPTTLQTVNWERPRHIVVEARYPWRFWRVLLSNYSLTVVRESGIIVAHFIHFYAGRSCAISSQG
jgi:hypothetical protein